LRKSLLGSCGRQDGVGIMSVDPGTRLPGVELTAQALKKLYDLG